MAKSACPGVPNQKGYSSFPKDGGDTLASTGKAVRNVSGESKLDKGAKPEHSMKGVGKKSY